MKSNKEARTPNYTIGCIETLYACGKYSQKLIAQHLGVSESTVSKYIKQYKAKVENINTVNINQIAESNRIAMHLENLNFSVRTAEENLVIYEELVSMSG